MSNDHFVSVTFLTQFCDEKQLELNRDKRKIYVFDINTETFLDGKKKLIKQANKPDVDGIEQFEDRPNFRTELRSSEDVWHNVYSNIIENRHSTENNGLLIKYLCQMLMNNPKRQRKHESEILENVTEDEYKHVVTLQSQQSLGFKEPDYIHKQIRDISLFLLDETSLIEALLSLNYRFVINNSEASFVTSDSPFLNFIDYFLISISKRYALQFDTAEYSANKYVSTMSGVNQELQVITDSNDVRHINRCTREAANRYVYAASKDAF